MLAGAPTYVLCLVASGNQTLTRSFSAPGRNVQGTKADATSPLLIWPLKPHSVISVTFLCSKQVTNLPRFKRKETQTVRPPALLKSCCQRTCGANDTVATIFVKHNLLQISMFVSWFCWWCCVYVEICSRVSGGWWGIRSQAIPGIKSSLYCICNFSVSLRWF